MSYIPKNSRSNWTTEEQGLLLLTVQRLDDNSEFRNRLSQ